MSLSAGSRLNGWFCSIPLLCVFALIVLIFAALARGATESWSLVLMEAGCLSLLVLVLLSHKETVLKPPGWLPLLLLSGFVLFQLIPLPPTVLAWLSPATWVRYREGVWLMYPDLWLPISVHPKATFLSFLRLTACAAFYLAAIQLLGNFRKLKLFVTALVAFGGLYAALGLLQFVYPSERIFWVFAEWPDRTAHHFATYVNGNHFAGLMGMLLPLALALALYHLPRRIYSNWRDGLVECFSNPDMATFAWLLIATVLMGASIFFSLSRGGVLASMAALTCFVLLLAWLNTERKRVITSCLVLALIIGAVGWVGWGPVFERFAAVRTASGELNTQRIAYWQDSWESIVDYPLFGTGFGTFADAYPRVQSLRTRKLVDHAHNDYVELAVEGGLVGSLLVAWFLSSVVIRSFRVSRRRRHPFSFYLWLGAMTGLISILLHSLTDFNLQIPANGLMLSALLALLVSAAHTRSREGRSSSDLKGCTTQSLRYLLRPATVLILVAVLCYGIVSTLADAKLESIGTVDVAHLRDGNQRSELLRSLKETAALDPLSGRLQFALGQVAWFGEEDRGQGYISQALKLNPVSGLYANRLASTLRARGGKQYVSELYATAARNDRAEPDYWKDLGGWYLSTGETEKAVEAFRQLIHLRPLQTTTFLTYMILEGLRGDDLERSIPDNSEAHLQIAEYLHGIGKGGRAEIHLEKAMRLAEQPDSRNPKVFRRVADFFLKSHREPQAFLALRRGVSAYPENPDLLLSLASLSNREGLTVQAVDYYRKLILLDPNNSAARNQLKLLESAGQ